MRVEDSFREILEAQTYWFPVFGTFVSFDPAKRTGIITPAFLYKGIPAPQLQDVKVLLPGGGGWTVELAPVAGDFALILFCGAPTADFWERNLPGNYDNASPSDAVAIPFAKGALTAGASLKVSNGTAGLELSNSGAVLSFGTTTLEVGAAGVTVTTPTGTYGVTTHVHTGVTEGISSTSPPSPGT